MQGFRLSLSLCAAAGLCAISIAGVTNALAQAGGVPFSSVAESLRRACFAVLAAEYRHVDEDGAGNTVLLVVSDADRVVPMAQAQAYLARFPGTESLSMPGGHVDLVAPWMPAWDRVRARVLELAR